jgi:hypothetical protein
MSDCIGGLLFLGGSAQPRSCDCVSFFFLREEGGGKRVVRVVDVCGFLERGWDVELLRQQSLGHNYWCFVLLSIVGLFGSADVWNGSSFSSSR